MQPMDEFTQWLIQCFLTNAACRAGATEAAAFVVDRDRFASGLLRPVTHVRHDDSDQRTRENAIRAFEDIALPCVRQGKAGAIDVGNPDESGNAQFCLVVPFPPDREARLVFCLIVRARSEPRAREALNALYGRT